ncbi:MAG: hypothetical protein B7Z81_00170 [Acidocella sp. 20-61-6]|nr:MAG: hypothetical protein B7Z81_00170 [Acidocella sp. 20-61-6]
MNLAQKHTELSTTSCVWPLPSLKIPQYIIGIATNFQAAAAGPGDTAGGWSGHGLIQRKAGRAAPR